MPCAARRSLVAASLNTKPPTRCNQPLTEEEDQGLSYTCLAPLGAHLFEWALLHLTGRALVENVKNSTAHNKQHFEEHGCVRHSWKSADGPTTHNTQHLEERGCVTQNQKRTDQYVSRYIVTR